MRPSSLSRPLTRSLATAARPPGGGKRWVVMDVLSNLLLIVHRPTGWWHVQTTQRSILILSLALAVVMMNMGGPSTVSISNRPSCLFALSSNYTGCRDTWLSQEPLLRWRSHTLTIPTIFSAMDRKTTNTQNWETIQWHWWGVPNSALESNARCWYGRTSRWTESWVSTSQTICRVPLR